MACDMQSFLDLRRLRYFMAIAEHGSLSAAARSLNLAQPALSHHIGQLESLIGSALLHRRHDGVSLTETGSLLHRHAVEIDARVRQAEAELLRLASGRARIPLRLAVISSFSAELTPALLGALARDMPDVVLRITESGTLDSRELLDSGKADLALSLASDGKDAPLARERLSLVSAAPGNTEGQVPLAQAIAAPLILPARQNPLRELLESAATSLDMRLNVVLEIDGAGPRLNAVLAGHGSTVFGTHYVESAGRRAGLSIRPIGEPPLFRPLFLGARRGLDPALVQRARTVLAEAMSNLGTLQPADADHSLQR